MGKGSGKGKGKGKGKKGPPGLVPSLGLAIDPNRPKTKQWHIEALPEYDLANTVWGGGEDSPMTPFDATDGDDLIAMFDLGKKKPTAPASKPKDEGIPSMLLLPCLPLLPLQLSSCQLSKLHDPVPSPLLFPIFCPAASLFTLFILIFFFPLSSSFLLYLLFCPVPCPVFLPLLFFTFLSSPSSPLRYLPLLSFLSFRSSRQVR